MKLKNRINGIIREYHAKRRLREIRRIVNPNNRELIVYYPGFGCDTWVAKGIGAKVQIGVDCSADTADSKVCEDNFTLISYRGDAHSLVPPELKEGIDVFINKYWVFKGSRGYSNMAPDFKHIIYNAIREGGFELNAGELPMFRSLNPELFDYRLVLDKDERETGQTEPFGIRVFQKKSGLYFPLEIFEIDKVLSEDTPGPGRGIEGGLFYDTFDSEMNYLISELSVFKSKPFLKNIMDLQEKMEYFKDNAEEIREKRLRELSRMASNMDNKLLIEIVQKELQRLLT